MDDLRRRAGTVGRKCFGKGRSVDFVANAHIQIEWKGTDASCTPTYLQAVLNVPY